MFKFFFRFYILELLDNLQNKFHKKIMLSSDYIQKMVKSNF
jgi:hypothetical protein